MTTSHEQLQFRTYKLEEILLDGVHDNTPPPIFNVGDVVLFGDKNTTRSLLALAYTVVDTLKQELGEADIYESDVTRLKERVTFGVPTGLALDSVEFVDYGEFELARETRTANYLGWELVVRGNQQFTGSYMVDFEIPFVVLKVGKEYRFGPYDARTQKIAKYTSPEIQAGMKEVKNVSGLHGINHGVSSVRRFNGIHEDRA